MRILHKGDMNKTYLFLIGDTMKNITKEMIKIYNLKDFDFMGYKLVKNQTTFHHIIKKENKGEAKISNGSVLMPENHTYLHIIEHKEYKIYDAINKIMLICNKKGKIEIEDLIIINELLKMFEEEHMEDKTSKGKTLIKEKYLDRIYYDY